jgi:hypothetical protein
MPKLRDKAQNLGNPFDSSPSSGRRPDEFFEAQLMRARIFTIHHRIPQHYVTNMLMTPLVNGVRLGGHPELISDEHGLNIANKISYCEMCGQYYVWKNLLAGCDYVGFQHYRRYFFLDVPPLARRDELFAALRRYFLLNPLNVLIDNQEVFHRYRSVLTTLDVDEIAAISRMIGQYDIIVARPWHYNVTIREQYVPAHRAEDWDAMVGLLSRHSIFRSRQNMISLDIRSFHFYNMYIMRASEFDAYMSFWHELMSGLEDIIRIPDDPYQKRVFAFLSERVFCLYFHQLRMERPDLRVLELPLIADQSAGPSVQ